MSVRGEGAMTIRLNDDEAEKLVLARGLITPDKLAPYRVQASVDSSMLFDILVTEGVITPELVAELEKNAPPPPPPRSITGRPTGFLQRPTAPVGSPPPPPPSSAAPAAAGSGQHGATPSSAGMAAAGSSASNPAVTQSGSTRRLSRGRSFEDTPGSSGSRTAVISPSTAFVPPPTPTSSAVMRAVNETPIAADTVVQTGHTRPRGWPGLAPADPSPSHVQQFLLVARQSGASDLYLNVGAPASVRMRGEAVPLDQQAPLTAEQSYMLLRQLMTAEQLDYFNRTGDLSFSYAFFGGGRYRVAALKHRNGCDVAVRVVPDEISTLEQLGFPQQVQRLAQFSDGIVLVAGLAGSGKTATIMSIVEALNRSRQAHILMLEDPAEYHLKAHNCQITQREIGTHSATIHAAFESALREDPDILLVGELRDHATTMTALAAAEAGQMVFSTVAAPDCARAIDRIFETPDEPMQVRNMLADNLRALLAQQLVPRADGNGRIAACELLINSISVGNIIREAKTQNLINVMQTGKQQGMIMMDDSLKQLVADGVITGEEAFSRAKNKTNFMKYLEEAETVEEPAEEPLPAPAQKPAAGSGRK
jgi:twitching motility protein PilT